MEAGLLRGSFVPPKPQRQLRTLTRYRKTQIAERQREANRLHKALEDTGIKLDCVASDILGKSGRAMLDALVQGTTDPEVLADLAKGLLRKKIPALREALQGRFEAHHALVIGAILAHLDFLDEHIARLSEATRQDESVTSRTSLIGPLFGSSRIGGHRAALPSARVSLVAPEAGTLRRRTPPPRDGPSPASRRGGAGAQIIPAVGGDAPSARPRAIPRSHSGWGRRVRDPRLGATVLTPAGLTPTPD
jgi:hypothetical protein